MDIISTARREADLADNIVMRTFEVYGYDQNITNYEAILPSLPEGDWPSHLAHLRGLSDHEAAFACDPADIDVLSQYQFRDRIANLIKSERVERAKAAAILGALDAQLTGSRREAALQAAVARREAALAGS